MKVLEHADILELLFVFNWTIRDVKCNMACNLTIQDGRGQVKPCNRGTMCPYTCREDHVANFRTLNCTEDAVWIPSMSNPTTTTDFCYWTAIVSRASCGQTNRIPGSAAIPNGELRNGYYCDPGRRCRYDCGFLYSKNNSVSAIACTYTGKWISYMSRDEMYEELEVDVSTLCIYSPATLAILLACVIVPVATVTTIVIFRRRCKLCCTRCTKEAPRAHQETTQTNRSTVVAENARRAVVIDLQHSTHSRPNMQSYDSQRRNVEEFQGGLSQTPPDSEQHRYIDFVQPRRLRPPPYAEYDPNLPPFSESEQQSHTNFVHPLPIGLTSNARIDSNLTPPPDTEFEFVQPTPIRLPSYSEIDPNQPPPPDTDQQRNFECVQHTPVRLPSYSEIDPNQPPAPDTDQQGNFEHN